LVTQCEELTIRLKKYEDRVKEFEEQNTKHNDLHERMKARLQELTLKLQKNQDEVSAMASLFFYFEF
jgi:hypothetical protein